MQEKTKRRWLIFGGVLFGLWAIGAVNRSQMKSMPQPVVAAVDPPQAPPTSLPTVAAQPTKQRHRTKKEIADDAYSDLCGEAPTHSGWDGAIVGLKSWLQTTANDPDSTEVTACTEPYLSNARCWVATCNVRGRNGFGAKVLQQHVFSFSTVGIEQVK